LRILKNWTSKENCKESFEKYERADELEQDNIPHCPYIPISLKSSMKRQVFFTLILLTSLSLWAQDNGDERLSFIGMTLEDLIGRFGTPKSVIVARGNENWQDDVVFQYTEGDFYIYVDRVWQVRLASAFGISNRDRKAAVLRTLGNMAEDRGDHVLFSISASNWPLMLRVNFNNSGQVNAIYLYRSDF